MSEPYTQEFRDMVWDWTELKNMSQVFSAVAAHDAEVAAQAVATERAKCVAHLQHLASNVDIRGDLDLARELRSSAYLIEYGAHDGGADS